MERKDQFMCESCGTVAAARTKTTKFDRLLRHVSGHKRFRCDHCGWTGLRNWSHAPAALDNYPTPSRSRTRAARPDSPAYAAAAEIEAGLELLSASTR